MKLPYVALAAIALAGGVETPVLAQVAPKAGTAQAARHYTTADTEIGTLLDDADAKAIVEKHIPGMTANPQLDMARSMTLKGIQQYAPEDVTDARLAAIDADFAKLP